MRWILILNKLMKWIVYQVPLDILKVSVCNKMNWNLMHWCSHNIHTRQIPVWELLSLLLSFMGFHQWSFPSSPYSLPSLHGLIAAHHFSLLKNFLKFQAYLLDRDGKNHDSPKLANRNEISYSGHPPLITGTNERTGRCCTVERSLPWNFSGFWSIHSNLIGILGIQISTKSSNPSSCLFFFFRPFFFFL